MTEIIQRLMPMDMLKTGGNVQLTIKKQERIDDVTEKKIFEWYNNPNGKPIYGYMYGYPVKNPSRVDLVEFSKDEVVLTKNTFGEIGFSYVWGWPGPSSNFYKFCDYGKTWAFSVEELISSNIK